MPRKLTRFSTKLTKKQNKVANLLIRAIINGMDNNYEIKTLIKFDNILKTYTRKSGYSPSQVVSVMAVLDCDEEEAMSLIDYFRKYEDLDWSEATWYEIWKTFSFIQEIIKEEVAN